MCLLLYQPVLDVLKFDNSYSWARSKEVFYSVKILAPDTDICSPRETTPPQTAISNGFSGSGESTAEQVSGTSFTATTDDDKLETETGLTTAIPEVPPN